MDCEFMNRPYVSIERVKNVVVSVRPKVLQSKVKFFDYVKGNENLNMS